MIKFQFILFSLFIGSCISAQNSSKSDSLIKLSEKGKNDTAKVNMLITISDELSTSDPEKSLQYAEKALKMAGSNNWNNGIGESYNRIAYAYYAMGNFSSALENWQNELKKRIETEDKINICGTLGNIGVIYFMQSNYPVALQYYLLALKQAEALDDKNKIIANLCNVAMVYKAQENYDKALEYHLKALKIAKENNDETFITSSLGSIGGIYWKKFQYDKAILYYSSALIIDEKSGKNRNVAAWLSNIGGVFVDSAKTISNSDSIKELLAKALFYNLKALKLADELEDDGIRTYVYSSLGYIYVENKLYNEAEKYLEKSLELAIKNSALTVIKDNHLYFSKLYEQTGEPSKAYEHYKLYVASKDSILNEKNEKTLSELQIKYETEKREAENKSLEEQNKNQALQIINSQYLIFGLGGLIVLVIGIGVLLIRQNRLKSQKQAVLLEQKLLRMQMNPHFIFNSLASIESFIYEHQPKEAGMYLSQFSRLIRLILENSTTEYITLDKEIETLDFYLKLQKLRLNDALDYTIEVDKAIIPDRVELPPMLTQPFIENAIEHGFRGITQTGRIDILFKLKEKKLEIQITDNGIGIVQAQQQKDLNKLHKSMAMQITQERLKFLNKSKRQKLDFSVTEVLNEKQESTGTRVVFSIPL
jgi:tetratricopeptide (TPR) repeat protein